MSHVRIAVIVVLAFALPKSVAWAQQPDTKDAQIEALKKRVDDLEARLARLEGDSGSTNGTIDNEKAREAQQLEARARMKKDIEKHSQEELFAAEQLYQVANKNWRSPEAKACLEQMVEKYPDLNRTGCAVLYLAQMAVGNEKVKLLNQAISRHSDCFYGDGVQVGAYARFLLAKHYLVGDERKRELALPLVEDLKKQYPYAVDHHGHLLAFGFLKIDP
ncbi:MAG TPA: hypothetical protein VGN12_10030 [Pirellulales bacterium]|jgi:hypothetical protein